jgi:hypothetical protein
MRRSLYLTPPITHYPDDAKAPSPMQLGNRIVRQEKFAGTFNQRDDEVISQKLRKDIAW